MACYILGTWTVSSVQLSPPVMSNSWRPHGLLHARPPCPSPIPGVYSNSCPSSWWCHPSLSSLTFIMRLFSSSLLSAIRVVLSASDQIRSVAQSCLTLCDPMNRSTPGLPVHHQLPEFTQTPVHRVGDPIQPSHPLSSPSPPAPNPILYNYKTKLNWEANL